MSGIEGLFTVIGSTLLNLIGQIGPLYDPLFWDIIIYIFGTIMFAVFLLAVIAFYMRRNRIAGGSAKEGWIKELDKYFESGQIGLIPDEKHHW